MYLLYTYMQGIQCWKSLLPKQINRIHSQIKFVYNTAKQASLISLDLQKLYINCKDIYIPGFVSLQNVSLFVSISCTIFWYNAEPASAHSQEYCAIQFLRTSKYLCRKNGLYYNRVTGKIRNKYVYDTRKYMYAYDTRKMCMMRDQICV